MGQAISIQLAENQVARPCSLSSDEGPCGDEWDKQSRLLWIFIIGIGINSIIKPLVWLLATRMTRRYPKLAYAEIFVDFQLALAWMVAFTLELNDRGVEGNYHVGNVGNSRLLVVHQLWQLCWTFMCLNSFLWLTSGIMNSRELLKARRERRIAGNRRSLIRDELEDQPDVMLEPRPSAVSSQLPATEEKPRDLALGSPSYELTRQPATATTASPSDYFSVARAL